MDPNVRYRCENCGQDVRNARFRFCRSCELKSTPIHGCPGCGGPCRGRQCRQCHKSMYEARFCSVEDCYGKRVPDTYHCSRCITDMHRRQGIGPSDHPDHPAQSKPPPSHNPFAAYEPHTPTVTNSFLDSPQPIPIAAVTPRIDAEEPETPIANENVADE